MKKLRLILALVTATTGLAFIAYQAPKPWVFVAAEYSQALAQEENSLMGQFFKFFSITDQMWQNYKTSSKEAFLAYENRQVEKAASYAKQPVSTELAQLVNKVIVDSAIDRCIDVHSDIMTHAIHNKVFIDESELDEMHHGNQKQLEASILHEMQHLIYEDLHTAYTLETLKQECIENNGQTFDEQAWDGLMTQLYLFREKRADLMAGCSHPDCVKAQVEFWTEYIETNGDNDGHGTHPRPSQRLAYCTELSTKMGNIA